MKKALVLLLFFVTLLSASTAQAEQFVLATEKEPVYRPDTDLTIAFPVLNGTVWSGGKVSDFEGCLYHFHVPDKAPDKPLFLHFIVWQLSASDKARFREFVGEKFKALLKKDYPNKKFGPIRQVGEVIPSTLRNMYNCETVEFQTYEQIEQKTGEGEEAETTTVNGNSFNAIATGIFDSETGKYYILMYTGQEAIFNVSKPVLESIRNGFYIGKESKTGLVVLVLILSLLLVAGGVFFYINEKKKAEERKRRLRALRDEMYEDDDDYYDDYYDEYEDDYYEEPPRRGRAARGGRAAGRAAPRSSRGAARGGRGRARRR